MRSMAAGLALLMLLVAVPVTTAETDGCITLAATQIPPTNLYLYKNGGYIEVWSDANALPGIQPQACGGQAPDWLIEDTEVLGMCAGLGVTTVCV